MTNKMMRRQESTSDIVLEEISRLQHENRELRSVILHLGRAYRDFSNFLDAKIQSAMPTIRKFQEHEEERQQLLERIVQLEKENVQVPEIKMELATVKEQLQKELEKNALLEKKLEVHNEQNKILVHSASKKKLYPIISSSTVSLIPPELPPRLASPPVSISKPPKSVSNFIKRIGTLTHSLSPIKEIIDRSNSAKELTSPNSSTTSPLGSPINAITQSPTSVSLFQRRQTLPIDSNNNQSRARSRSVLVGPHHNNTTNNSKGTKVNVEEEELKTLSLTERKKRLQQRLQKTTKDLKSESAKKRQSAMITTVSSFTELKEMFE